MTKTYFRIPAWLFVVAIVIWTIVGITIGLLINDYLFPPEREVWVITIDKERGQTPLFEKEKSQEMKI